MQAATALRKYWRRLTGTMHPDDTAVLARATCVNIDFPPPAFIGNIDTARVIVLEANGGYDAAVTPTEFPDRAARSDFIAGLHGTSASGSVPLAPYYRSLRIHSWLSTGELAIVNAMAYRSPKVTDEVRKLADALPSVAFHRNWLRREALPAAARGECLIIAQRWGPWNISPQRDSHRPGIVFSSAPVSPHLPQALLRLIEETVAAG